MNTIPQDEERLVNVNLESWVWHWCAGCERKRLCRMEKGKVVPGVRLHLDLLKPGDWLLIPKGRKHYDGSWDTCEIDLRVKEAA